MTMLHRRNHRLAPLSFFAVHRSAFWRNRRRCTQIYNLTHSSLAP